MQKIKENKAVLMLQTFPEFTFSLFHLLFGGVLHSCTCENSTEYRSGTATAVAFFTSGFTDPDLLVLFCLLFFFLNYRSNINHYQPSASVVDTQISASRTLLAKPDLTASSAQFTSVFSLIWCQECRAYSSIMLIRIKLLFPCWLTLPSLLTWQDNI